MFYLQISLFFCGKFFIIVIEYDKKTIKSNIILWDYDIYSEEDRNYYHKKDNINVPEGYK